MRIQTTFAVFFVFGVMVSGCDVRKSETTQKSVNSSTVSQTQNIQPVSGMGRTNEQQKEWEKSTDTSKYKSDSGKNDKALP